MELEDEFDDLLAEISEPTSPKQLKLEPENTQPPQPGKSVSWFPECPLLRFHGTTFSFYK